MVFLFNVHGYSWHTEMGKRQFLFKWRKTVNTPRRFLADFPNAKSIYLAKRNEINNTLKIMLSSIVYYNIYM